LAAGKAGVDMRAQSENVIWQYWETRGVKPKYIDGLHEIAKRNSGVNIVLVTPETLRQYLPDIEADIFEIEEVAHKADMIRTRLVKRYGGMWLDSDAVVLSDLNWLFEHLKKFEFVGFNNGRRLQRERPWIRVNCFLSRPNGSIINEWVRRQSSKLPKTAFGWSEIGAEMLNKICLENKDLVAVLPFERICPVPPKQVENFLVEDNLRAQRIIRNCFIVMLTNRALQLRKVPLQHLTVEEIAAGKHLLAVIVKKALGHERKAETQEGTDAVIEIETVYGSILAFENDFITKQILKFGAHTRTEIAFLRSVVRPGDFIFDLGAHIGTYAIPLAQKAGGTGKLLAVEGRRENFQLLERNLKSAGLEAGTIALNALVARPGQHYAVRTPKGNTGGTYFIPVGNGGVSTAAVSIDQLCERFFAPRIVKLDIEGGEVSALAGSRLLQRERPIVYAEVNRQLLNVQGTSIGEFEELLRGNGYRLFRNVGERHAAHDRFVVAELRALPTSLNNFDVLAIHESDDRLDLFDATVNAGGRE
jgi:FkbM family methyltransferase